MYVWVLLATFIAMLYAFNLSTREDMRSLYTVPQANRLWPKSLPSIGQPGNI